MNLSWVQWVHIGSHLLPVWYCDLRLIFIFWPPLLLSVYSMARGQEVTSTSQAGCRRGPSRESPSASSIISPLSMDEVMSYCQILEDIEFESSEGPAESIMGKNAKQCFSPGSNSQLGFASPCHPWSSNSCTSPKHHLPIWLYPPKRHSDYDWMMRTKPSLSTGPFIDGILLCLHLKASAWWPTIHVGLEPPATIRYGAPRFVQVRGKRSDPG